MNEIIQVVLFFGLLIALTPVLGRYMARVFQGEKAFLHPVVGPVERLIYKLTGVAPALLGVIVIVAALTFFPALCLGPIVEHGLMNVSRTF